MIAGFIALIAGDETTQPLVGNRVYPLVLPRDYKLPAVVVHRYGGTQDMDLAGPVGIREDQIQIDVYAKDAAQAETAIEAIRALIVPFVGPLDGKLVQGCFLERQMDMPFLPNADTKGIANRSLLGFRVVSDR